ncbi:M20 family metallopeptidase [Kocuria rhizophila]|uniref:M20 metallopeptidase family protein n=1 Tax=Kocuria rhizophila TaxID=72000 RepID=UPI00057DF933|nr:M20 family metallopeptidase [Kocuria rhizophila]KIC67017.1 amidohydrolase [Kocuria rhizophila]MCR4525796.1 M20 family metallopeptidase [Kocuria rhizophila]
MSFLEHATALQPELVALRRSLHAHPEVGNDLPWTQQRIVDALDGLDLEITLGRSVSSVVAVLRGARPGPTVLLRGDMDGLPVAEQTGLEYASTTGAMHACGHDLHMAGLVGAAHLLSARRDELAGNVVFMFQPGEEGPGGAKPMIEEGLLEVTGEKPVAAYGIHVFPGERGLFTYRPGTAMAGANYLHVTFHGEGGHGSQPHTAKDPVPALLEFGTALQTMVTRRFSVFDPVVASITQLFAGEAINVIPDRASLGASVRTLSAASDEAFPTAVRELAHGIAAAHGVRAEVEWTVLYPLTRNDDAETAFVASTLAELVGEEHVRQDADPLMGSEDFSFVLQEVPGCFFFLECSPPELAQENPGWNHSPTVLFDDAVLGTQAAALAELAWRRLQRN